MYKTPFRSFLGLMLLLFLVFGARSTAAAPQLAAVPPARPESLTKAGVTAFVNDYVEREMAAAHAPGVVVTIVYRGEVILAKGYGFADLGSRRPMTPQTNLRAGSVSKPVTSTGVLQMAAQGLIDLHEPLSSYLPDLPLQDRFGPAATVAQHLTLQGGYADTVVQTHAPTLAGWQPLDTYLAGHLEPRALPPGKVYSYNSWDHALLGQMMAATAGRAFPEAMAATVFEPLGMVHTTFAQPLPGPIAANLARGYAYNGDGYDPVPLDFVRLSPGIGLVTTGEDMGRFMLALLDEGQLEGERVLDPSTVEGMLNRQEEVHPYLRARTYGLSEVTLGDREVLYQDGNGIGHGSRLILAPEHKLGIFLSTNHRPLAGDISPTPAYQFIRDLGTALLQQYLPPSDSVVPVLAPLVDAAARAPRYAGHYRVAAAPQHDFFKLHALLDNVNVAANGDGTISVGSTRYVEVEPLVFQSRTDASAFVVFAEDDRGAVMWLTFGGTNAYERARWYETPPVQVGLVVFMLLVFLSYVILMPLSNRAGAPRQWLVWLMSLLNIVFLAGLAYMMSTADLVLFFKAIPLPVQLLFLLPWLSGLLALALPVTLVSLWRSRVTAWVFLHYMLLTLATGGFIWFAYFWNLYPA